jgi:PAS domain S-box-containing protein
MRDLRERQLAEDRLCEQALILDHTHDAVVVTDLAGRITFWNQGAERLYGWSASEALGLEADWLLSKSLVPELEEAQHTILEQGNWQGELQHVKKDGGRLLVRSRWALIHDRRGRPKAKLTANTDITEARRIETDFLRSQRLESIGLLASGIAHDLNNALAPIRMAIELLRDKLPNDAEQQLLETIGDGVGRATDMVSQLVTFAGGAGGPRLQVPVRRLVGDLRKTALESFPKSICIVIRLAPDLRAVSGDPTQLYQVLLNLCINARDAMPQGGGLTIAAENVEVVEEDPATNPKAKPGPYVVIAVSDTGSGITRDIRRHLFEPFFTTKRTGQGTGLGLATALTIVTNHGGFIRVASEPGSGSTFSVYLPATAAREHGRVEARATAAPRGRGELVLVVDDEAAVRVTCQRTLEASGYRVLTAGHGAEALALYTLRSVEIDVVLCDLIMPVLDGAATIRELVHLNPEVAVITTTGAAAKSLVVQPAPSHVRATLSKPFTAAELLETLDKVLHGSTTAAGSISTLNLLVPTLTGASVPSAGRSA